MDSRKSLSARDFRMGIGRSSVLQLFDYYGRRAGNWKCYFYITDGWPVYPMFIPDKDQILCKTYMTRVEGENTRLRHYLARLHRKTLCYSKSVEMLKYSIRLVIHYLKFWDVPVPYPSYSLYQKDEVWCNWLERSEKYRNLKCYAALIKWSALRAVVPHS